MRQGPCQCVRVVALLTLLAFPLAHAGTPEAPELVDPVGDQQVQQVPAGMTAWGQGHDLVAVWFTDDAQGLHATIQVTDLAATMAERGVQTDAMFIVQFTLDHADKSGPGGRLGQWELRGDFAAANSEQWSYRGEGPCKDGNDADGCAGTDRDIIDSLPGTYDVASSTVTITLPWTHLGHVQPGDGIASLEATTQYVYPNYPVYTVDWDTDQRESAAYRYASVGLAAPGGGDAGMFTPTGESPAGITANGTNQTGPGEAPGRALPLLLAGLALAAGLRRRRAR